jgi:hypothetical protein
MNELVYGAVTDYLVFIPRERALELTAVREALESAKTWGEFRRRISPEDYEHALSWYEDLLSFEAFCQEEGLDHPSRRDEAWAQYTQLSIGVRPPVDEDAFKIDHIPPYYDGDYPEWPAASMYAWVPKQIQETLGRMHDTRLNGEFLTFDPGREHEVVAAFEAAGYVCVRDDRLTRRASGYLD